MTRPTIEQIEQARALVACDFEARRLDLPVHVAKAYDTLLAATAELSEEELVDESLHYSREFNQKYGVPHSPVRAFEAGYFSGARREGRK